MKVFFDITFENVIDDAAVPSPYIIIDIFTMESRNFMSKCQSFERFVIIGLL